MKKQIKNVDILDLQEKDRWRRTDVTFEDGKILSLKKNFPCDEVYDGKGLTLSPGFIDVHMHEENRNDIDVQDYDIAECMLKMGVTTAMGGNCGSEKTEISQFFQGIDQYGSPINYCLAAGYNSIRKRIGIADTQKPKAVEMEKIHKELKRIIDEGAFGITFGIEYNPNISTEEILEALKPFYGRTDIFAAAHFRYDGNRGVESIEEMAYIARMSQIPFEISHLSSCCAFGNMKQGLQAIEDSLNEGVDILVDAYPYDAFSTQIGTSVFEGDFLSRWDVPLSNIVLTEAPYEGVPLTEEILKDARENYPTMLAIAHVMKLDEVKHSLTKPYVMVASDGLYSHHKGHPRGAGTFPRVLGDFVREGTLTLSQAIYKCTTLPAKRLGLEKEIGTIAPGYRADMVLFDPKTIQDQATFEDGQKPPVGIHQVWVNGELAIEDNQVVNNRLGKSIRRK